MSPREISQVVFVSTCLLGALGSAHAVDSASVELATGNRTQVGRVGIVYDWNGSLWRSGGTHVRGYWDATLAEWRGTRFQNAVDRTQRITDVGVAAMLRLEGDDAKGFYAEGGLGPHWLSAHYDNNDRQLSTNFQFESHLGGGYVFNSSTDLGLRISHTSNGGFRKPNDGVNLIGLRMLSRF